jgi:hypothetical protein
LGLQAVSRNANTRNTPSFWNAGLDNCELQRYFLMKVSFANNLQPYFLFITALISNQIEKSRGIFNHLSKPTPPKLTRNLNV